jgi:hypothetical protein
MQRGFGPQAVPLYDQLEEMLTAAQLGDIASDHKQELEGFHGWNYVAIMAAARLTTRSIVNVYDDSTDSSRETRKQLRLRYGFGWQKAAGNEHVGEMLPQEHLLVKLLKRPNPFQTGSHFRMEQFIQLRLHGSCLVFNRPNVLHTRTVERYVIPLAMTQPIRPGQKKDMPRGGIKISPHYWAATQAVGDQDYSPLRLFMNCEIPVEKLTIVRVPHPYFRSDGASATEAAKRWIDCATAVDVGRAKFHQDGPNGKVLMTCEEDDPKKIREIQERLNKDMGPDGPRVVVVGKGTAKADGLDADEMAFDSSHDQMRDAILAAHGVSRALVGNQDSMTYGSLAASMYAAVLTSVQPDMDFIADEDTLDLAPQYGSNLSIEYEVPPIEDPELEDKRLAEDVAASAITMAEYRTKRGLPLFGDARDQMMMSQGGPIPVDKFLSGSQPAPAAPQQPLSFPSTSMSLRITKSFDEVMTTENTPLVKPVIAIDPFSIEIDDGGPIPMLKEAGFEVIDILAGESDEAFFWDVSALPEVGSLAEALPESPERDRLLEMIRGKEPKQYKYGCVYLPLPEEIAAKFREMGESIPVEHLDVGGVDDEPHITLLYGIHGCDSATVVDAVRRMDSMFVSFGMQTYFPAGSDGCPVKIDVESPALHAANRKLKWAVPYVEKFPEYHPHATIAYVRPEFADQYGGVPAAVTRLSCLLTKAIVSMPGEEKVVVPLRQNWSREEQPRLAMVDPVSIIDNEVKSAIGRNLSQANAAMNSDATTNSL